MTGAELAAITFTAVNTVRALAYLPQIVRIAQDDDGAQAVSRLTWSLFAVSHLATVAYALATVGDLTMAVVFGVNAIACLMILGLTTMKRCQARGRTIASSSDRPARRSAMPGSTPQPERLR